MTKFDKFLKQILTEDELLQLNSQLAIIVFSNFINEISVRLPVKDCSKLQVFLGDGDIGGAFQLAKEGGIDTQSIAQQCMESLAEDLGKHLVNNLSHNNL